MWGPRPHFWSNNNMGSQKFQNMKMITNGVLEDCKWEYSKSGIEIQIEVHLTAFMAQKTSKIS